MRPAAPLEGACDVHDAPARAVRVAVVGADEDSVVHAGLTELPIAGHVHADVFIGAGDTGAPDALLPVRAVLQVRVADRLAVIAVPVPGATVAIAIAVAIAVAVAVAVAARLLAVVAFCRVAARDADQQGARGEEEQGGADERAGAAHGQRVNR